MSSNPYPVLDSGLAFFNHAGVSPLPADVAQAVHDYADQAGRSGYFGSTWMDDMADFRQVSAELIGARSADEIAFVPNTATGVSVSAGALNLQNGDRILVTDAEYPSNRHFYNALQQRGVELDVVYQHDDGRIPTEDILAAVGERTKLVGISHVQWGSGFRSNLRPIADAVHAVGGLLSVDAIQSAGALPVNVAADDVDILAAGGHKWMLGPTGSGMLYVREELIGDLIPPVLGANSMDGGLDSGNEELILSPTASRFEPGATPTATMLGMRAAIRHLLNVGIDNVWAQLESVTAYLCDALTDAGCRVFSPRGESERSGIVIFDPPEELAARETVDETWERLQDAGIITAVRFGRLRASPHFYTPESDINRLAEALRP
ncbi:MAG: aminotransferase class V-fold PLP-dependent enzyme [Chloroflexi bacterium]|nr:aminotransferase class V-fold PLP-dependent enzyme [Chloroflexota bacterium]MXX80886.1 aminotransferase class V-fold PLP-dependent enzyme [Chloroflexota bacterium]MYD17425.1 aminotransferase class V-fold PLP-dependent enzyme [Chloroflexota bacterium]MYF22127.1 aminotransferase class V-fold PLP-dependent enzyme [Chloroflexota bacterium]